LLPQDDQDNIGGDLVMHEMLAPAEGVRPEIRITNLGRLPHFAEYEAAMTGQPALATTFSATLPASEVTASLLGPEVVRPMGKPGIALETSAQDGHFVQSVFRDDTGAPKGVVRFPITETARAMQKQLTGDGGATVFVDPAHRRKGIATRLFDRLRIAGFDIDAVATSNGLTPDGAALMSVIYGSTSAQTEIAA